MARKVLLLLGTKKGAFILESDETRKSWSMRGPYCSHWPINHVIGDAASGTIYAGGGDEWFGPAVWQTSDLGETWTHSSEGLSYSEGVTPIKAVWSLARANGTLHVGVEPAGLFRSRDDGKSFIHVDGLQKHPSREHWTPGAGGLILHSLVPHPDDPEQMWIAISAAGVFYTADGGKTWETRNKGTRADFFPEGQNYPEFGQCVHCLVMAPGRPDRLYQQNHCGMYRCEDGAKQWESIEDGLPSSFGFPAAAHPRDPDVLFLVPLNGAEHGRYPPDARAAVWRTRDAGKTWDDLREGLPQKNAYFGVLRQAMATDTLDKAGVYFGTSSGELYGSADEGDSWNCIATHLPPVYSVETMVID
ncbi:exo-alpha-sialidase [Rhizobiaceae bacterium n13]|uniref:Exo-alpha-sialidase n=1 Tax=Ferirhizobium litorale TaxID=2927786 RepID=A0AAE3Q8V5_9HYPH|nr:exo-alpha-sialidase [Fererhizobium litorale]MDI7861200.1 exo-alpha-sialidase [Fererhizobium litorale]MDI7921347.1 exo-alpha-sialidase [Fererhizobium litorale]